MAAGVRSPAPPPLGASMIATLAENDRLFLQGALAVALALGLAMLLQGRLLDTKDDVPIPPWLARYGPLFDACMIVTFELLALGVAWISVTALSSDEPLDSAAREQVGWALGLMAVWAIAVAVWRRVLPVLFIESWGKAKLDDNMLLTVVTSMLVALTIGAAVLVAAGSTAFVWAWLVVAGINA